MRRTNIYNKELALKLGGKEVLERFVAKQVGGDNFAAGRSYEMMFISFMIIMMAAEFFSPDTLGLDPYDLAEGLECLVDDLMTRRGDEVSFFQIKSGRITDRKVLKQDIEFQQTLDKSHSHASYYLIATPRFAPGIRKWLNANKVRCKVGIFPHVTGLNALLSVDGEVGRMMAQLTGSKRQTAWVALHRTIVGKWMEIREYSIRDLFLEIAEETRYQSPPMINDEIRLEAFFVVLESYEIYPDDVEEGGVTLRAYLQDFEWSTIVPCDTEMLNKFDRWYEPQSEVSPGDLMRWFEEYSQEEEIYD